MPNELTTTFARSPMTIGADDFDLLMGATSDMGGGGETYLKHDGNSGIYSFGSSGEELDDGEEVAVDFTSLMRGYICWKDGTPADETMRSYREGPPPPKHTLPDHGPYEDGDGWQEQTIIKMRLLRPGTPELTFKASGITKLNALGRLVKDFSGQVKSNFGMVPIVSLSSEEFESKAKGARGAKKFAPKLKITGWESPEAVQAMIEGGEGDYEGDDADTQAEGQEPELVEAPTRPANAGRTQNASAGRQAASGGRQAATTAPARGERRGRF